MKKQAKVPPDKTGRAFEFRHRYKRWTRYRRQQQALNKR